jgi:hypothetical protein
MAISDSNYNKARNILVQAGSASASTSHPKHTQGNDSPDSHGQDLLREARDEFRGTDARQQNLQSGMTAAHYTAIHSAAQQMDINDW